MSEIGPNSKWRRAIIYLVWGEKYLAFAIKSANSAAFMGVPFVLVTDRTTAEYLSDEHPFSAIKIIDIPDTDRILKTRLWEFLPEDYNSFLFLDVDTTILMDVTFGFEMAERHGIAAAAASHYCLDKFRGFGEVMTAVGVPHFGQNQFNTGVIFFVVRPDVKEVFRHWSKFAYELTEKTGWKRVDQPFFTLAIEKLGFNPYTLSPNYNYRAIAAEHISGDVRLWHSYHAPPANINDYETSWPRSRYLGGTRPTVLYEVHTSDIRKIGKIVTSPSVTND